MTPSTETEVSTTTRTAVSQQIAVLVMIGAGVAAFVGIAQGMIFSLGTALTGTQQQNSVTQVLGYAPIDLTDGYPTSAYPFNSSVELAFNHVVPLATYENMTFPRILCAARTGNHGQENDACEKIAVVSDPKQAFWEYLDGLRNPCTGLSAECDSSWIYGVPFDADSTDPRNLDFAYLFGTTEKDDCCRIDGITNGVDGDCVFPRTSFSGAIVQDGQFDEVLAALHASYGKVVIVDWMEDYTAADCSRDAAGFQRYAPTAAPENACTTEDSQGAQACISGTRTQAGIGPISGASLSSFNPSASYAVHDPAEALPTPGAHEAAAYPRILCYARTGNRGSINDQCEKIAIVSDPRPALFGYLNGTSDACAGLGFGCHNQWLLGYPFPAGGDVRGLDFDHLVEMTVQRDCCSIDATTDSGACDFPPTPSCETDSACQFPSSAFSGAVAEDASEGRTRERLYESYNKVILLDWTLDSTPANCSRDTGAFVNYRIRNTNEHACTAPDVISPSMCASGSRSTADIGPLDGLDLTVLGSANASYGMQNAVEALSTNRPGFFTQVASGDEYPRITCVARSANLGSDNDACERLAVVSDPKPALWSYLNGTTNPCAGLGVQCNPSWVLGYPFTGDGDVRELDFQYLFGGQELNDCCTIDGVTGGGTDGQCHFPATAFSGAKSTDGTINAALTVLRTAYGKVVLLDWSQNATPAACNADSAGTNWYRSSHMQAHSCTTEDRLNPYQCQSGARAQASLGPLSFFDLRMIGTTGSQYTVTAPATNLPLKLVLGTGDFTEGSVQIPERSVVVTSTSVGTTNLCVPKTTVSSGTTVSYYYTESGKPYRDSALTQSVPCAARGSGGSQQYTP